MTDRLFDVDEIEADRPDLPTLQGTEKQLGWAGDVRRRKLAEVDRLIREWQEYITLLTRTGKTAAAERERAALRTALDAAEGLAGQMTCRWWLDHRENSARELLSGAAAKPGGSFERPDS